MQYDGSRIDWTEKRVSMKYFELQLQNSKLMLVQFAPHTAVTDIAFEVGFGSLATFERLFKKKFGTTPSQYRKFKSD
jgi:AraC-like DNA-binding protein